MAIPTSPHQPRKTPSLAAKLLRYTCPVVVFGYLVWVAAASRNWKLALCLAALILTLGGGLAVARRAAERCEAAVGPERQRRLDEALKMTRRLGGVFCGMALGVGLCYTLEDSHFFSLALPILLSGWAAMLWIARRGLA